MTKNEMERMLAKRLKLSLMSIIDDHGQMSKQPQDGSSPKMGPAKSKTSQTMIQ